MINKVKTTQVSIQKAIDDKLTSHPSVDTGVTLQVPVCQKRMSPWSYLTATDWQLLEGDGSIVAKIQVIVDCIMEVCVINLNERTVEMAIAMFLTVMYTDQPSAWPSYNSIHATVGDLKKSFQVSKSTRLRSLPSGSIP